jgi:phage shock protein C
MVKKLYKSQTDRVFAGVIGGIGEYYEIDPTIIRLAYILVAILTGIFPAIVGYFVAYLVVPKHPDHIHHVHHAETEAK